MNEHFLKRVSVMGYRGVFWLLVLLTLNACALVSGVSSDDRNAVREAVVNQALTDFSVTDELVLAAPRNEDRIPFNDFGFERVVWLYYLGEAEYMGLLPPDRSYLYVGQVDLSRDQTEIEVPVLHYDGQTMQQQRYRLQRSDSGTWQAMP